MIPNRESMEHEEKISSRDLRVAVDRIAMRDHWEEFVERTSDEMIEIAIESALRRAGWGKFFPDGLVQYTFNFTNNMVMNWKGAYCSVTEIFDIAAERVVQSDWHKHAEEDKQTRRQEASEAFASDPLTAFRQMTLEELENYCEALEMDASDPYRKRMEALPDQMAAEQRAITRRCLEEVGLNPDDYLNVRERKSGKTILLYAAIILMLGILFAMTGQIIFVAILTAMVALMFKGNDKP